MSSSAGTASSTEFSSIATIERLTVSSEMIAIGTPYCTERLIVPTSRVTRVTRSPVLAPSTRPRGSRRIVSMMYSRAEASRSWPNSVEVRWPRKVNSDCATTTARITSASEVTPDAEVSPETVRSIRSPSRRGTSSARRPRRGR